MICRNCGKEIPDDVKYCGYCGALQTDENKEQTVDIEKKEEEKPETVLEEEKNTEENAAEKTETSGQTEQKQESEPEVAEKEDTSASSETEDVMDAEIVENKQPDSAEQAEPAEEKKVSKGQAKEKFKSAGSKIADSAEPIIENSRKAVHRADWSSFNVYKEILQHPFDRHDIKPLPLWTGIIIMIFGSWFTFGSFGNGLFVLVFTFAGLMITEYISDKGNEEFHLNKSFEHAFSYMVVPFIASLAAGIIFHSANGDASVLTRRLGLVIALLVFAASTYGKGVSQCAGQSGRWLSVIAAAVVYSSVLYYLLMQHISAITAVISML